MSNNNTPPPWSEAPPWARYRAQDEDGTWWRFGDEPKYRASPIFGFQWQCDYGIQFVKKAKPNPNWRDTLQKRPKNE